MVPEVGHYVKASYSFSAQQSGELSLQAGDIVKITNVVNNNWLQGETIYGASGIFPANFVEPLVLPDARMGQRVFVALVDFPSQQTGDLELAKGDIILGTEPVDDSWWRGKLGPLRGIFPLSCVHELEIMTEGPRSRSASLQHHASSLKSRADSLTATSETLFARALVDVIAQIDDELTFQIGDLITIKEIIDDDWLYGECHNKVGLVSTICVELLTDFSSETPSTNKNQCNGKEDKTSAITNVSREKVIERPVTDRPDVSPKQDVSYRQLVHHAASYTSENTRSHDAEITPYAKTVYAFQAQTPSELSFSDNEIVTLIQHVDEDWIEGELDGKIGLFPASFVEIIVDCPHAYQTNLSAGPQKSRDVVTKSEGHSNGPNIHGIHSKETDSLKKDTIPYLELAKPSPLSELTQNNNCTENITCEERACSQELSNEVSLALVLHSFQGDVEGDLSVNEGDTIEVIHIVDTQWLEARDDNGRTGLVPVNHVQLISGAPRNFNNKSEAEAAESVLTNCPEKCLSASVVTSVTDADVVIYNAERESVLFQSVADTADTSRIQNLHSQSSKVHKDNQGIPSSSASLSLPSLTTIQVTSTEGFAHAEVQSPVAARDTPSQTHAKPFALTKPKPAPKPSLKPPLKPKPVITPRHLPSAPDKQGLADKGKVFSDVDLRMSLDNIVKAQLEKAKNESDGPHDGKITNEETCSKWESSYVKSDELHYGLDSPGNDALGNSLVKTNESSASAWNVSFLEDPGIVLSLKSLSSSTGDIPVQFRKNGTVPKSLGPSGLLPPPPTLNHSSSDSSFGVSTDATISKESTKLAKAKHRYSMPPARPVPPPPQAAKDKRFSFVNQAFESDTEGRLINVNGVSRHPPQLPPPPSHPVPLLPVPALDFSGDVYLQGSLERKPKRPPPRPMGPRVASAPSKIPLQPVPLEGSPKPVPHRAAPIAPAIHRSAQTPPGPQMTLPSLPAAPASAAPSRIPPRPTSVAMITPPRRPPPRLQRSPADLMRFSPESAEDDSREVLEIVADLKKRLQENRDDIVKYELSKGELEKKVAIATQEGENDEEMRETLQFLEETLQSLKEEEKRLKSNLFKVSPREEKLEKARLVAEQRQADERLRQEEVARNAAEERSRHCDKRQKVLQELIDTEKDYLYDLQLCLTTFFDSDSAIKVPASVDVAYLFGNMEEIAEVSQRLLTSLESATSGKEFQDQVVGIAFVELAEDMKETYAPYCRHHDDVIAVLDKYRDVPEACQYFSAKVEEMRQKTNIFDMEAMLIKPVQRILKYPLLLNELNKCTEDDHPDKVAINKAIRAMTDVATAINEYKRRKDLVFKYKCFSDQSFATKIAKLNLHSIKKKSSRMRGRLTTNLGIGLQLRDEKFEQEESRFRAAEKAVKVLLRNVLSNMEQMEELISCQECLASDIAEYFGDKTCEEVTRYVTVHRNLMSHYRTLTDTVKELAVDPLSRLVAMLNGPNNVIDKRFDKLLDYNNMLGRGKEEKVVQAAKNDYEAMNAQLLDELPKLYDLIMTLMKHCMAAYVRAQRDFMDQALKENCILLELPSLLGGEENVMENFNIRHTAALDQISMLYFIPRGFNPKMDAYRLDRRTSSRHSFDSSKPPPTPIVQCSSQSESQRVYLRQMYGNDNLYQVTQTLPAQDLMDMAVTVGMLVAVIKDRDPMGGRQRWFVDDGANKGFVHSSILQKAAPSSPSGSSSSINDELDEVASECSSTAVDDNEALPWLANQSLPPAYTEVPPVSKVDISPPPPYSYTTPPPQREYCTAEFPFQARSSNEVTICAGQIVEVLCHHDLDGNPEWWLVDADGYQGYAPASYLRKTKS